ncbi:MAG: SDR family oxidoreductase [Lentilactobacillus diolivorans]|jgi:NADP-dependent 3-hydroxy acid dehydrogenase YdfG|uniref:SDR family oxidoreductase n=1 Tax=Lentilactobacillus diolivorans TaxID=179838 RepID=UPI000FEFDA0C|nr:SDR family oxidoreductase [Lentilactobacillus diolivorans]MCH4164397.1 SDR family oxidoreductase [Lentilactobacillus diolivorans]MDH5105035.1 SDR family oxidoreductase [Lentilactobacillus diolivorans]RRG03371.1 MAG: SDR family NAD(P)-dependent oxidoreductase [Lactobacillus sp.]
MGKVIVITGASSGIGETTAKLLAKNGHQLVLGARRDSKLQQIVTDIKEAGGTAVYKSTDVTDLSSVKALAKLALDSFGKIDVWMNNAGLMPHSEFIKGKVDDWNRMIDVNLRGVLYGINAALPSMRAQKSGQFINMASVAAHAVHQGGGVYSATKAGVLMISEALRQEEAAAKSNVRVTVVSPGAIATELVENVTDPTTKAALEKYYQQTAISPDRIASSIMAAIDLPADASVNEIVIRPTGQE